MICKYCDKICKNPNSLRNHERLCNSNPNKQHLISSFIAYNEKIKKNEIVKKYKNHFDKAKKLGLPIPEVSEKTKQKLSKHSTNRKWTEDQKKKHSEIMKKVVEINPESYSKNNVVGRVKNIEYNGVNLKGSWEFIVAKWLDENKIIWEYESKFFIYEWNGEKKYFPDFYLPEYDLFLEVKGYITDRDINKWKKISNLIVLKKNNILDIVKNKFIGLPNLIDNVGIYKPII